MAKGCCARTSDVSGPILGIPILLRSQIIGDSRVISQLRRTKFDLRSYFLGGCVIELLE